MQEKKKKIMVVEDNPMNKILMKEVLTVNGYDVTEAGSGSEAIKKVSAEMPDLILMDLNLPEMDGITATKLLKANDACKAVPVIAITASAMKGEEEKILAEGFDGYISKPIEIKKFIKDVAAYIKKD
ncbi:MAG: response regulator [Deltaproteobacteria bacterium]|nr:response regulator [Deltaproteobacteria bacterium]